MEIQQAKDLFLSDPFFVVSYIIENNPEDVYNNLQAEGINIPYDPNSIYDKVMQLFSTQPEIAESILHVPYNPNNGYGYHKALYELGVIQPMTNRVSYLDEESGESTESIDPSDEDQANNFDWTAIINGFTGLGTSIISLISSGSSTTGGTVPGMVTADPEKDLQKAKDNTTLLTIAVIIGVIILFILIAKYLKSKK